jgi:hypothetical protein
MKGIKFLKEYSSPVHESETDEEGTLDTFKKGEIFDADIFAEETSTVDIQFGDGSVAFNIPKDVIEVIEMPLTK